MVALNSPCPFFKRTTIRIVDRLPQRLEGIQGDDPAVRTSLAIDDHDLLDRGDVGPLFEQLVHLPLVFRKDHSTLGVGDDVSTLIGGVRRVDGRGCAARTQDADIRKNPLDARSRQNGAAILELETQLDETERDRADLSAHFAPAHRLPSTVLGKQEGLHIWSRPNAMQEHLWN